MKRFLISAFFFAGTASAFAILSDDLASLKIDANKGKTDAIIRLAECYERGDGVPADKATALAYYLVAFKQDKKNEALKERIAALGGERFLPGGSGVSGKKLVADLGNGVKIELLQIPAGTFTMGSPSSEKNHQSDEEQVRVRITKPFYLGKTEVTQAQWKAVMGSNPSSLRGDNLPVERVSWNDAMEFCEKLTKRERAAGRLPRGWKYTLPTEAQWEYACRAGTTTRFSFGNSDEDLFRYANFADKNSVFSWKDASQDDGFIETSPVGFFRPNAWGLYDMHGNVWEWCADWYANSLSGGDNPTGSKFGSSRVNRGGGWGYGAQDCRSAFRYYLSPDFCSDYLGFRLAAVQE